MDKYTTDIVIYSCITERIISPSLNYVERTVLHFLRRGYSKEYISQKMALDISIIMADLTDKSIIRQDLSFKCKNVTEYPDFAEKEYLSGNIFFDKSEGLFFDTFLLTNEMVMEGEYIMNCLGENYTTKDIIDTVFVTGQAAAKYNARAELAKTGIRLSRSVFEYLDYVYEGW